MEYNHHKVGKVKWIYQPQTYKARLYFILQ